MDDIVDLLYILILITLTAFFVISEFAIVNVRKSKIEQFLEEGRRGAKSAKKIVSNLDDFLSACQLGITITSLALGWLGVTTIKELLQSLFNDISLSDGSLNVISFVLAFALITYLHIVFGELTPKIIAIQKAEQLTLRFSFLLVWFYRIMSPILWFLNGSARGFSKLFGVKQIEKGESAHTEEELRMILSESFQSGEINFSEFRYVNNVFEFDNRVAKEIMVPRTEIVSIDINDSYETVLEIVRTVKFTRYPITDGDKDHIIGLINIKELLTGLISGKKLSKETIESYIRPIIRVIDTIPIHELLVRMQKERIHMAILMDEYGGTSGLVTVEDIVEEIVGEIRDEFDMDEIPLIRQLEEDHYIFDAKVLVSEVNERLHLDIDDEDVDTIGGWILTENFEIKEGDSLTYKNYEFKILEMEDHHIKFIEVTPKRETGQTPQPIPVPAKTEII
ncbi:hemolysin family protein [Fervidibacillus halotolerans]|uniref:Hemolysin family protein n=1 Tax=Fervidibacillus halotolerans TaxID=2980027 RepID=A0A9E8LZH0_9BACI|nr:hemolysin family protein [Fervidibacillus halotolerans]WAA12550.1 hemolysin family protein [Fervidibacillus halotolerans]